SRSRYSSIRLNAQHLGDPISWQSIQFLPEDLTGNSSHKCIAYASKDASCAAQHGFSTPTVYRGFMSLSYVLHHLPQLLSYDHVAYTVLSLCIATCMLFYQDSSQSNGSHIPDVCAQHDHQT
ncbi:hypothetical protein ElyMa_006992600, partial [Elysia marginata]